MKHGRGIVSMTFTGLLIPWIFLACAESQSVEKTESQTCINGSCTTTTTESRSTKNGVSSGVSVGGGVSVNTNSGGLSPAVVVSIGGSAPSSTGGSVNLTACSYQMAPLSACSVAGADSVISPKHLGCTTSGNHAWSCQDSFSAAPPYPVVACSGVFSDSCGQIGVIY